MSLIEYGKQYPETIFVKAEGLGIVDSIGKDVFVRGTKRKRQASFREFVKLLKQLRLIPQEMQVGVIARGVDSIGDAGYVVTAWQAATKVENAQAPAACTSSVGCKAERHYVACPAYY